MPRQHTITWKCPHCYFTNKRIVEEGQLPSIDRTLELCDGENGGCNELVPIEISMRVSVEAEPIKIKQF